MNKTRVVEARKEKWFSEYVDKEIPLLTSKVVAITGTTSGMGYWAAIATIRKQASYLLLLNRSSDRSEKCFELLSEEKNRTGSVTLIVSIECDLRLPDSVARAAAEVSQFVTPLGGLDVLINNAGIAYFKDIRTAQGLDIQMQVNYMGHYLLTGMLIDALRQATESRSEARIVMHSSASRFTTSFDERYYKASEAGTLGGDRGFHLFRRYAQTKVAVALFAYELKRKLGPGSKIICSVADPGLASSDILEGLQTNPNANAGTLSFKTFFNILKYGAAYIVPMQSAADAAMPLIAAAFSATTKSGDFYVPDSKFNSVGKPIKTIENGMPLGKIYKESNIMNESDGKKLFEMSEVFTRFKYQL